MENTRYTQQVDTVGMTIRKTGYVSVMPYGGRHMDRSYLRFVPIEDEDCVFPVALMWRDDNGNPALKGLIEAAWEMNAGLG